MKLRPSDSRRSTTRPLAQTKETRQRGIVIVLFTIVLSVLLLGAGLAVDLGLAHVTMSRLSKAVDAGALSGARHATESIAEVKDIALRVAAANYGAIKKSGGTANYDVAVDHPSPDAFRVRVHGKTDADTYFSRMMGKTSIDVAAVAEATRWPLDLSLVLDISGSLTRNETFDDMQEASSAFLQSFNEEVDRFGIVTFSTYATEGMPLKKGFKAPGKAVIDSLVSLSDTNIEEGMRMGKAQLDAAEPRPQALKILVLFTDGRPTAFADALRIDGPNKDCPAAPIPTAFVSTDADADGIPDCWGGVIASLTDGGKVRGIFLPTDGRKVIDFAKSIAITKSNGSSAASTKLPLRLPKGKKVDGNNIRNVGIAQAEEWAAGARAAGYTVYTVGLGTADSTWIGDSPDLDFLRRLANEDGIVNAGQPRGELLFSPTGAELQETFARLADRILTRLTY